MYGEFATRCKAYLLAFCLSLSVPLMAMAQGTVEGTVTDSETGGVLPGAQVLIGQLNLGAVTDADGQYSIDNVPAGQFVVEVRFIGFSTQQKTVTVTDGQTAIVDFQLGITAINLDEVVVTGAGGPVEKKKLGNSISTIDAASLQDAPVTTFSEILQGREPGVIGEPSGGTTGVGSRIRIRGSASLSQSNEPIVYIDGVRANNGGGFGSAGSLVGVAGGAPSRLDDINPEAIERVEILKGAAAATLYGTEASNGVIQIFTKRGLIGPPRFSFQSSLSSSSYPGDRYKPNTGFARNAAQADTMSLYYGGSIQPYQLVERTFMEDLFETGLTQTYSASVNGGSPGITYYASFRYQDEDGPFGGNDRQYPQGRGIQTLAEDTIERFQGNASVNIFPTEALQIRVASGFTTSSFATMESNNNIYGVPSLAQFSKPEQVSFNNETGTSAFATVNEALQQTVEQQVDRFYASIGMNYRPLQSLTVDGTFGIDFTNQFSEELRPFGWDVDSFTSADVLGRRAFSDVNDTQVTFDVKGTLRNELGENFESTFIAGGQGFITSNTMTTGEGEGFPGPGFNVTGAAADENVFESFTEVVNAGIFFQEQLGFRDQVYFTVGGRLDANSAFGESFDAVFYPKASLSFIPSDAGYWNSVGPISSLRFRAAIGQSGLQPGAFDALTTFKPLPSISGPGVGPNNLGNSDLKPEVSTEWELGTEMGLFSDRVGFEATYWNRVVDDALVAQQFPVTGGFRATQLVNIGQIEAQGVEMSVNAMVYNSRDFSVSLFANGSYLWEQVTDMGGAAPIKAAGSYSRVRNFVIEDYAPGTNFGAQLIDVEEGFLPVDYNGDGAPDSEAELVAFLGGLTIDDASLPRTTDVVLVRDDDGDGDLLDHYIGKPTPDWQGAFGGSIKFLRNFSLYTLFEYKAGNYFINNLTDGFRNQHPTIGLNTPDGARVERDFLTGGVDANGNPQNSGEVRLEALDEWVNDLLALAPFSGMNHIESADFIRWRELSLTYNVPTSIAQRLRLRNMSFTVGGRNLALWTRYSGVDPELNTFARGGGGAAQGSTTSEVRDNNFRTGIEAFGFTTPRRFTFTLRVGF